MDTPPNINAMLMYYPETDQTHFCLLFHWEIFDSETRNSQLYRSVAMARCDWDGGWKLRVVNRLGGIRTYSTTGFAEAEEEFWLVVQAILDGHRIVLRVGPECQNGWNP